MLTDYHTHTPLCKHAEGEPEAYVAKAIEAGLVEYGISDHAPAHPEPFDDWRMSWDELPLYLEWVEKAKAAAGEKVAIRSGLECDWLVGCENWIEKLRNFHDWDYLIGSVHYINDKWDFDNPKWLGKWATGDVESYWQNYWNTYHEMVKANLFDFYGHPDLVKKFAFYPEGDLKRFYEPIIETLASNQSCIELNTAGLRKPCEESYPSAEFLQLASDANLGITITSDAHHPDEVAHGFEDAVKLVKSVGFKELIHFKQGLKKRVPLQIT